MSVNFCTIPGCQRVSTYTFYCNAHGLRIARGETEEQAARPFRPRGKRPQLLEKVIALCETQYAQLSGADIAHLLRENKP